MNLNNLRYQYSVFYLNHPYSGAKWIRYLYSRGSEVRDLELDADGGFALVEVSHYAGESEVGLHEVLLPPRERFDSPDDGILLWRVLAVSFISSLRKLTLVQDIWIYCTVLINMDTYIQETNMSWIYIFISNI
jgi:hypothetical protein